TAGVVEHLLAPLLGAELNWLIFRPERRQRGTAHDTGRTRGYPRVSPAFSRAGSRVSPGKAPAERRIACVAPTWPAEGAGDGGKRAAGCAAGSDGDARGLRACWLQQGR